MRLGRLEHVRDALGNLLWIATARGDVRVDGTEQVLRPRTIGAVLRAETGRSLPDVGDVRSRLDQYHLDAELTLAAAIAIEEERGERVGDIETVWRRKAALVKARLAEAA